MPISPKYILIVAAIIVCPSFICGVNLSAYTQGEDILADDRLLFLLDSGLAGEIRAGSAEGEYRPPRTIKGSFQRFFPESWEMSSLDGKGNDILTEEMVIVIEYFEEA